MNVINIDVEEPTIPSKKGTTISSFSITIETKDAINELSKNLGISKSEVVNRAVSLFLKDDDALVKSIIKAYKEHGGKEISIEEINKRRVNIS